MHEDKQKEAKKKLKELRRELEEKIKSIIPENLKEDNAKKDEVVAADDLGYDDVKKISEALLFSSARPLTVKEINRVLKGIKPSLIKKAVTDLSEEYKNSGRSFAIREIAGGYELSTLEDYSVWIKRLEKERKKRQASMAALETLAILAYKQPVTKVEIEEIRGVDVTAIIATLLDRGLIKIVGKKDVPGRPLLYGTTKKFLEYFGLKSLGELPDINEIKSLVESTIRKEEILREEVETSVCDMTSVGEVVTKEKEEELNARYKEISSEIDNIKVVSANKLSKILEEKVDAANDGVSCNTDNENVGKKEEVAHGIG